MKKTVIVIFATGLLALGILIFPYFLEQTLPHASITKLSPVIYTASISITGEISREDEVAIETPVPIILGEVLVKEGESVKSGQPIAYVNRAETVAQLAKMGEYGAVITSSFTGSLSESQPNDLSFASLPETITAPQNGYIENICVQEGDYLAAGSKVAAIAENENLQIEILVPENNISRIAIGQNVEITGTAFPDQVFYGNVSKIARNAVQRYVGQAIETVIPVSISFSDPENILWPGFSAKVKIYTAAPEEMMIIPYEAVHQDENNIEYVLTFENGKAYRKDIITGLELQEGVQILSGVTSGDTILVHTSDIAEGNWVIIAKE